MSRTLAPIGVGLTEESLVITPAGTRVTGGRSVSLSGEGTEIPGCTTTGTDGIAACRAFQPLVMFVGGAWDVRMRPMLDAFTNYDTANEATQDIGYVSWNKGSQLRAIALHWALQSQKIVLVGHSMGGRTAHQVSKAFSDMGRDIELLVTLDPVFRGGARPKPSRVKTWLNVHVDYTTADRPLASANDIAWRGGPWQNCPGADRNAVFWDTGSFAHARAMEMLQVFRADIEAVT